MFYVFWISLEIFTIFLFSETLGKESEAIIELEIPAFFHFQINQGAELNLDSPKPDAGNVEVQENQGANSDRGLVGILRLGGQYLYEILKFAKKHVLI